PRSQGPSTAVAKAGRVVLPFVKASDVYVLAGNQADARPYDVVPSPVTSVALGIDIRTEELMQWMDEQIPHPDQMFLLNPFAAREQSCGWVWSHQVPLESAGQAPAACAHSLGILVP